ncbi:unannotated protein [freshwater metagenome]|uniref:Unannotated protein n=1 Tax=freshwater metagenome TaxID=449393 RepID=A0A6J6I1C4_9ZZZZ|nr:hypothetical protein [Actinomycetota bacterium]
MSTEQLRIRKTRNLNFWIWPSAIFLVSTFALWLTERIFRAHAVPALLDGGYRFQSWSSDTLMQTMGLNDMVAFGPVKALWLEHIYTPGFDAIRLLLALPETLRTGVPDPVSVDYRIYMLYCIVYGSINALVFVWVRDLTRSTVWAFIGMLIWALYPGNLMVMMLLDGTAISLLAIAFSFYFLYRFLKVKNPWYITGFAGFFLIGSLTRSFIQIHVLIILVIAMIAFGFMAKWKNRPVQILNLMLAALVFFLPIKQFVMYDTLAVSTFTGYHRAGMLWIDPRSVPDIPYSQKALDNAAAFVSRENTVFALKDNLRLEAAANTYLRTHPVDSAKALWRSLQVTIPEAFRPTSDYVWSSVVEWTPWKTQFNWLFSSWRYLCILFATLAVTIWSRTWKGFWVLLKRYAWFGVFYLLVAFPVIFSNRFRAGQEDLGASWTDAMRLKIFIEVPVYVLVAYALWILLSRQGRNLHQKFKTRDPLSSEKALIQATDQ